MGNILVSHIDNTSIYEKKFKDTIHRVITVDVPVSEWSLEAPYTQTIDVPEITAEDSPIVKERIDAGTTYANEKAIRKAAACISYIDTYDGHIEITCIGKKPAVNFKLDLKAI